MYAHSATSFPLHPSCAADPTHSSCPCSHGHMLAQMRYWPYCLGQIGTGRGAVHGELCGSIHGCEHDGAEAPRGVEGHWVVNVLWHGDVYGCEGMAVKRSQSLNGGEAPGPWIVSIVIEVADALHGVYIHNTLLQEGCFTFKIQRRQRFVYVQGMYANLAYAHPLQSENSRITINGTKHMHLRILNSRIWHLNEE